MSSSSQPSEVNLGLAAQCWCDPETQKLVMIPELAMAFAKRLDEKDEEIKKLKQDLFLAEEAIKRLK